MAGYGLGGMMNTSSVHGSLLTGAKGPFSLTQWAELEQQALIYKYITANVPVPSSLLLSLKKSFFPYGSLPPNSCKLPTYYLSFLIFFSSCKQKHYRISFLIPFYCQTLAKNQLYNSLSICYLYTLKFIKYCSFIQEIVLVC